MSDATFMVFHNSASSTAMGPTMAPLELFIKNVRGSIVPDKMCAAISSMSGRWVFQTARLHFPKKYEETNRPYSYRPPFLQNTPGY